MLAAELDEDHIREARQLTRRRKRLYSGVMVIATAAFLLLLAEAAGQVILGIRLSWQRSGRKDSPIEYDAFLGWSMKKNYRSPNGFGQGKPATHNSQGFRGTHDYALDIPTGRYRIICLGDSFTHGAVGDIDTFPAQLEALAPTIEAVNMGGGAYGIDQDYLWYKRDGIRLHTNLLLFAFIEDDFRRATTDTFLYRYPKPLLALDNNVLVTKNVPVPRWGGTWGGWLQDFPKGTALYRILRNLKARFLSGYDVFSVFAVFSVAERIFDDLNELSRARNQSFVLVYLPTRLELTRNHSTVVANWVENVARAKRIPFLNMTGAFKGLSASEIALHFLPDGHYSERGNLLVAKAMLHELRERFPEVPR